MASLLAPYTDSMKLGSGFNSFTQELCVDNAVVCSDHSEEEERKSLKSGDGIHAQHVAQSVVYKTSIIDKATDVTDILDIKAAFTVKYDNINAGGAGKFVNTNTLKSSDVNFMISCKVVNEVVTDHSLTKFSPISGILPVNFPKVYGDSFISGFQTGGEFNALISVKISDRDQVESISAEARINLTQDKLAVDGDGTLNKSNKNFFKENEVTISVSWTGGGQDLKPPGEDWTFETMKAAALKFPQLVAATPMRTHAILTKYTALKSFQSLGQQFSPLSYEHAGNYSAALQEAYLDYKNISKEIQVTASNVANGTHTLVKREVDKDFAEQAMRAAKPALLANMSAQPEAPHSSVVTPEESDDKSLSMVSKSEAFPANTPNTGAAGSASPPIPKPKEVQPFVITEPYPATVFGFEAARTHCRFMMNRLVAEVDEVARCPQIATDETRPMPYMSPFLFKMLLPTCEPKTTSPAKTA